MQKRLAESAAQIKWPGEKTATDHVRLLRPLAMDLLAMQTAAQRVFLSHRYEHAWSVAET
jgi:hypothetical protein